MLEYGDIWGTDDAGMVGSSARNPDDFLNTLKDGRLFGQLAGLRALTPYAYLMITGALARAPMAR